jgi:hypothetical protein
LAALFSGCRGKEAAQFFRGSFRNFLGKEMAGIEWPARDIEGAFSMARWGP